MTPLQTKSRVLAFDIGGSAIKTSVVDVAEGKLVTAANSLNLPQPPTPANVVKLLQTEAGRVKDFDAIGVGYPGVIIGGHTMSAAHMDASFVGFDFLGELKKATSAQVGLINDADAAGLAEMAFGAGRDLNHSGAGTVLLLTMGTGIGSALFIGGRLVPNTEFGHIEIDGSEAEDQAAASVKTKENLDWPEWTRRLNRVIAEMERLMSPVRTILGGGISENFQHFGPLLKSKGEIAVATLGNAAGLIGATLTTRELS